MSIRVVLIDDHPLLREGLECLLRKEPDIEVVAHGSDGATAVTLARQLQPAVMVINTCLPGLNGIEATHRIHSNEPAVKVLCRSLHDEARQIVAAMDAGAAGYVGRDASYAELVQGIRAIRANQTYVQPALIRVLIDSYRTRARSAAPAHSPLTSRERELVQLIAEGYSTQQIAQRLHISIKTVGTHREHVLHKLQLSSIAQLTRYAIREGLSSLELLIPGPTPAPYPTAVARTLRDLAAGPALSLHARA